MKILYHPEFTGAAVVLLTDEEQGALARLDQALTDAGIRPFCEAPIGSQRDWGLLFGWIKSLAIAIDLVAQQSKDAGQRTIIGGE